MFVQSSAASIVDVLRLRAAGQGSAAAFRYLGTQHDQVESLDYATLDRAARFIAGRLLARGAAGDRVLVCCSPGIGYLKVFFGCLYAGMIAVPLYPPRGPKKSQAIGSIAQDCAAKLLFCDRDPRSVSDALPVVIDVVSLDTLFDTASSSTQDLSDHALPKIQSDGVAYLQYTSGSTGAPKGVVISHRNVMANLLALSEELRSDNEVFVNWVPPYHDFGLVVTILWPVYLGCLSVLMPPTHFIQRPRAWFEAITRFRGTVCGGPNFAYQLCVEKIGAGELSDLDLSSWRFAINAAEPVQAQTLAAFADAFQSIGFRREAPYPCYGLAEVTVFFTGGPTRSLPVVRHFDQHELEQGRATLAGDRHKTLALVGCGFAKSNHSLRIVDPQTGDLLADGGVGEIWVRGPSVAQGYWDNANGTHDNFLVALRDSGEDGFFRTGDLGFICESELFITGRLKDIIIIRGRNYAPQDIDSVVELSHPALARGTCAAFSVSAEPEGIGEQLAIAVEVKRAFLKADAAPVFDAIRAAIASQFELHPQAIVLLRPATSFKTSSGKIQRRKTRDEYLQGRLKEVARQVGKVSRPYVVAETQTEERLALIWQQVLGVTPLGRTDEFLLLGGDSVKAVQVASRVQEEFGIELPVRVLFESHGLAACARALDAAAIQTESSCVASKLIPAARTAAPCLSSAQKQLFFMDQLDGARAAYNISGTTRLQGKLDRMALKRALDSIVVRHEVLRTRFGQPDQEFVPLADLDAAFVLAEIDIAAESPEAREAQLKRHATEEARTPFDLGVGPLIRGRLIRMAECEHALILSMHHIISDGWSTAVLSRELRELYAIHKQGRPALPPLPIQYADYASWQQARIRAGRLERQLEYWRSRLAGSPLALEIPTDRPRPVVPSFKGSEVRFEIPAPLSAQLVELAARENATLFMVLLAVFQGILSRYSGEEDVMIATPTSGRAHVHTETLVGLFVNLLPLRTDLSGDPTFRQLLARVKSTALGAFENQEVPFDWLVAEHVKNRELSRQPLCQLMFNLHSFPPEQLNLDELVCTPWQADIQTSKFDLTLHVFQHERRLSGSIDYASDLFEPATIQRLIGHLLTAMAGVVQDPGCCLWQWPVLTREEQAAIDFSVTAAGTDPMLEFSRSLGGEQSIVDYFAARVAAAPDQLAVCDNDRAWSYRQLDQQANGIANTLLQADAAGSGCIAVVASHDVMTIATMIGVLKAGRSYVPLEPGLPIERLKHIVGHCGAVLFIGGAQWNAVAEHLPAGSRAFDSSVIQPSANVPAKQRRGDSQTYILYTSGSTGIPKGVVQNDRNVLHYIRAYAKALQITPGDRLASFASLAFDAAVMDMFGALLNGASLHLRGLREQGTDGLEDWLGRSRITIWHSTPSAFRMLSGQVNRTAAASIRAVVLGGEAVRSGDLALMKERFAAHCILFNLYGQSESSFVLQNFSNCDTVIAHDRVSIGRPVLNTDAVLLAPNGRPTTLVGELAIRSAHLALGYWNNDGETARAFLQDPRSGKRLYRTGDRVRYLPDGTLEFLGRVDFQVKIRGFRIELGEIESHLLRHPAVKEAVVLAREEAKSEKQLIAYLTVAGEVAPRVEELREHLKASLPEYMVPSAYVVLKALPLTPNGKVDRSALPAPDLGAYGTGRYEAPQGKTEEAVAVIWKELLRVERVGRQDNFFELGGHSLMAVRLLTQLRNRFQVGMPVRVIFESPTLMAMAQRIESIRELEEVSRSALPQFVPEQEDQGCI